ncbi:MAG: hypothetical protein RIR69_38 [Actinomycetota bacterium]|jgi:hypothetical protein
MNWLPSVEGLFVSLAVMTAVRALWIWRKYKDHRFLRFVGWPEPYGKSGHKEYFWTSGTSGTSRAEVERALSREYTAKFGWLMTTRARRTIIVLNIASWGLVVYGGFDLPGGFGLSNGHLSMWGILPMVCWWAARSSARILADAPDELLDERLLAIRNSAYHEAYRLLGVFVSITVVVAIALDISITDSTREFGNPDWTSLSVTVPFVMIWALSSLPSLIIIARQSMED